MKCIHYYNPENRIVRVSNDEADRAVTSRKARYVSRSEWKQKVRDANQPKLWYPCGVKMALPVRKSLQEIFDASWRGAPETPPPDFESDTRERIWGL